MGTENDHLRMDGPYERFHLARPPYISDDHWKCVEDEADRLWRALNANDHGQALGYLKCLVESIARIVHEIDGAPVGPNEAFDSVVKKAHNLLTGQPGHQLANQSSFGQIATQASKIARNLADIRNQYGSGHGRSKPPEIVDEMLELALDGGLLWARWALRRVGYFAKGRPGPLIADLVGLNQGIFHAGTLKERLLAANLPDAEPHHKRSIGIAVGQRVMRETFVVRQDGLDPCLHSDDLNTWPRDYRVGLAYGVWFDPDENVTLTPNSLQWALQVLEPVEDCADELTEWVERIIAAVPSHSFTMDWLDAYNFLQHHSQLRPAEERPALAKLAGHIDPVPF